MQYNLVAVSNKQEVSLWIKMKFEIVCKIPKDFKPPEKDYEDALVMYKWFWIPKTFCSFLQQYFRSLKVNNYSWFILNLKPSTWTW